MNDLSLDLELKALIEDLLNDEDDTDLPNQSPQPNKKNKKKTKKRSSLIKYPRKPSINPKFMPRLRILKRDIRRRYSAMAANVFNSHDIDFVANFFREFSLPNIESSHEFGGDSSHPVHDPHRSHVHGIEMVVESFRANFLLMPDSVFQFHDVKVCQQLLEPGSRIISYATIKGTMLYEVKKHGEIEIHSNHHHHHHYCRQHHHAQHCHHHFHDNTALTRCNHDDKAPALSLNMLRKLEKPVEFLMSTIIIFDLDSNHRIKSMKMHLRSKV